MNKIFTFMRESSTARFFIPLGIFLIIFGVIMFVINSNNQDYIEIEAIVSNVELSQEEYTDIDGNHVDATYNVAVTYTVDGEEYDAKLEDVSEYKVLDKIKIYYNPKDPSQITQTKSLIIPIVIILAGLSSLIGEIVSLVSTIKRHKKMKEQERNVVNG